MNTRDPEFHKVWRARYDEACRAFTAREITEDVYGATLFGLGFRGQAIQSEINLHHPPSPGRPA